MHIEHDDFDEAEHRELMALQRQMRREELAKDLLLKIVETSPHHPDVDMDRNVRAAVEYTDALLAELERTK